MRTAAPLALVFLPMACFQHCPPSTPAPDALVAGPADAGVPAAAHLTLSLHERLMDGGIEAVELQPHNRTPIEPTRELELSANVPLHNYRIRLFDEADRAMVSDDIAENSDQRLDYRISLHETLKPGHRYTLILDAQSGSSVSDSQGNAQPDQRLELQVNGEREKAAPGRKSAPKKRRRR
jgi:hypothetical protein